MKTEVKQKIAFAVLMGLVTTGLITFTVVSVNFGFNPLFWKTWLSSWSIAYGVVIPVLLFIGPKIQVFVYRIIK